ncbi:DNA translocase FtsK [Lacticaseibacillus saniviri]
MDHYDGPAFLRGRHAKETPPVVPKQQPSKPIKSKPAPDTEQYKSTDPLAQFKTPNSVVKRDQPVKRIDYLKIMRQLRRLDEMVYLLGPDVDDEPIAEDAVLSVTESAVTPDMIESESNQIEETPQADSLEMSDEVASDSDVEPEPQDDDTQDEVDTATAPTIEDTSSAEPETTAVTDEIVDETKPVIESDEPMTALDALATADEAEMTDQATGDDTAAVAVSAATTPAEEEPQTVIEEPAETVTIVASPKQIFLPSPVDIQQALWRYQHRQVATPTSAAPVTVADTEAPAATVSNNSEAPTTEPVAAGAQPVSDNDDSAAPKPIVQAPVTVVEAKEDTSPLVFNEEAPEVATKPYEFPPLSLLADPVVPDESELESWVEDQADVLNETLKAFHVDAEVVAHTVGPTVTQFQVSLASGVKVNKITNLNDDLKLALAAKDIRIEAPIPGKRTVGIEIPNLKPRPVMLREVLDSPAFQEAKSPLTIALGVDLFGQPIVTDLGKMPHGLIAGATGSGKSVFINSLLMSLIYKSTPQDVRLMLIDPKAVELAPYNDLPHLVSPVISDAKAAAAALKWAVDEMENRYERLASAQVRNLAQYNQKARDHGDYAQVLPYIVIIIDELADLMMVAASEVQDHIARITQKARAAGIHLIVATQRPSVDVITGTIKNNIPTRLAFMVASQVDSRTIIDQNGAESLLGRGDMLYLGSGASQPIRLQGTFVDTEVNQVVDFVKHERQVHYLFQPDKLVKKAAEAESQDELFPQILTYLADEKTISTSKLQRAFSIGYNRAANIIDDLEMRHFISPANGSKPRDVYLTKDDIKETTN